MGNRQPICEGEKGMLIVAILLLVMGGWFACWHYSINVDPVVEIPTPTMPSPNAKDYYLQAYELKVDYLEPFTTAKVRIEHYYPCLRIDTPTAWPDEKKPSLQEMQALMKENAPVFAMTKKGFRYQYHAVPIRSFDQPSPQNYRLRKLAQLMVVAGIVKCAGDDYDAGAECFLDAMRMSVDLAHGASFWKNWNVIACQQESYAELWPIIHRISGEEAHRGTRRMEEIISRQVSCAEMLREEKWAKQASLVHWFKQPGWRRFYFTNNAESCDISGMDRLGLLCCNKRTLMREYTDYMDALITYAEQPYSAQKPPAPLRGSIDHYLTNYYDGQFFIFIANETQHNLLLITFALRAYHADHGAFPANMKALIPAYLKKMPPDPFAAEQKLKYQHSEKSYLLYSVGPDGNDDGGVPSMDGQHAVAGKPSAQLSSTSTGDIVAGINVR